MATYYVRASGGSDGNTGLSFAQAFANVWYGLTQANTPGDILIICNDGTHILAAQPTFNSFGSIAQPISIIGGNATGIIDGSIATLDGSSLGALNSVMYCNVPCYYLFKYLRITNGNVHGLEFGSSSAESSFTFINCRFDNNNNSGVFIDSTDRLFAPKFINCELDNNGDNAIETGYYTGFGTLINCKIHNNGNTNGALIAQDSFTSGRSNLVGCTIYNNTGAGLWVDSINDGCLRDTMIINNVFYNNGTNGIEINDVTRSGSINLINNIFRKNTFYGIYLSSDVPEIFTTCINNCISGNGSGAINQNGGVLPGTNNITNDPLFTSESFGSEDFRLLSGSPCRDTGNGYDG